MPCLWLSSADGAQVAEFHQRVGGRFEEHQPRVFLERFFDRLQIGGIDIGEGEAEIGEHLIEQARRSAIEIVAGDDVVSGFEHAGNGVDRGHAAGEDFGSNSAFERGEVGFEPVARGIRDAGILVTFVLADLLLDVSGGGVNGDIHGAGQRVRFLSGMNGAGGKPMFIGNVCRSVFLRCSLFGGQV